MQDLLSRKRGSVSVRVSLLRLFSCSLIISLLLAPSGALAAPAVANDDSFITSQPSMLAGVMPGVEITPLLTVGDVLPNGYRFEAIPDGISVRAGDGKGKDDDEGRRRGGTVDIYVNHETSKVPFPYATAGPTEANSENDFDNAQVSKLVLDARSAAVLNGSLAIPSSFGYQRFCSNYLATKKEGFDRDILFTNEEAIDYVFRQEISWPPPIGDPAEKQIGLVVALDVQTGEQHPIYGMGRHNHENSVPVPGFDELVVLSGDDTFTSGPLIGVTFPAGITVPAQSQLYSYIAPDTDSLLADEGELWAFVSDTPGVRNYYDVLPGSGTVVTGHFMQVPKNIATGLNADGSEIKAADVGFPLPPTNGTWQRDNRTTVPTGIDGPQWVLEYWSDINNVFQFVRVEDIAYDKRSGMENVVYIVDSGRGRTAAQSLDTPNFRSTNGRVWKMVLDPDEPTIVTSLTVFVEGDDNPVKTTTELRQPDNIESTATGLLITEDPGSSQQFSPTEAGATTAALWYVPFSGTAAGTPQVVVKVDQSTDGDTGVDVDGKPDGLLGAWETSGIVDASKAFGPGAFLINVQAHSLWVEKAPGFDTFIDANPDPDFTFKREGGQLLLLRLPDLKPKPKEGVRFATFNASLNRNNAGDLLTDLSTPNNAQAKTVAEIIQRTQPDVLLINEFDFYENGQAAELFQQNYLSISQNGAEPIEYPYYFVAPSNTGIPSGFDLNNNGSVGGPDDAFGFGFFPGQFGMVVYSRYPIEYGDIRTFQHFLWKDMPGAKLPDDPTTPAPADWYSPDELAVFRLSSKSHWDIPIEIGGKQVHFLVSHPTPPVFDGPEDRNGTRNFDEIRFWADYISAGRRARYIYDDEGERGGLKSGSLFVIAGDQNSDPLDGDSIPGSIQQLLEHPLVNTKLTPSSPGAVEQAALQGGANTTHQSDPAFDTADFADSAPGNLRADYVLPRKNLKLVNGAVFWPTTDDPLFPLVGVFPFPSSDHRLVWVDVRVPGAH